MNDDLPPALRRYLAAPDLATMWAAARDKLERQGLSVAGSITVDLGDAAAAHLAGLLGRSISPGTRQRIKLTELDSVLRSSAGSRGLVSTLEVLDGRPLTDRAAARQDREARWSALWQSLEVGLAEAGLAGAEWVSGWIEDLRRTGILTRAGVEASSRALGHAVVALATLLQRVDESQTELATLAGRITADAHGFDDGSLASAVLLRAAARALGQPVPTTAVERRELWRLLGVASDSVSGTVLAWQLRPPGDDRWSAMMRVRADLGLVTHLTLHELDRAGAVTFAEQDRTVHVCENPQVLQAAAQAGIDSPLLCLSGNPATAGTRLLRALVNAGNPVRYHGDFDWPGVAIAGRVIGLGASPWLLSAADYLAATATLDADHALPLVGNPVPTPWDPDLAAAMSTRGLAVHEEAIVPDLLAALQGAA